MTEELKKYEASIKKKHSFGWTPKYEEEIQSSLNKTTFIPIAVETIEKIGWDLLYKDESVVVAERGMSGFDWGQKITVTFESGKVIVNSESRGSGFWDFGRNSKRVKLFIYAFKEVEKGYDKKTLVELEEEVEKENNWDTYEIPESLPPPKEQRKRLAMENISEENVKEQYYVFSIE